MKLTARTVGVLAFHGDFAEHLAILKNLGVTAFEVKTSEDLSRVHRLIIPGGESTVIAKFLFELTDTGRAIHKRVKEGTLPLYGTCAGAILLARRVTGKNIPKTLSLMDITVERNAYGTQAQSFETTLSISMPPHPNPCLPTGRLSHKGRGGTKSFSVDASFVRAPVITKVGENVEILATYKDNPVLVRQGQLLAGTFHPEMRDEHAVHELFLRI